MSNQQTPQSQGVRRLPPAVKTGTTRRTPSNGFTPPSKPSIVDTMAEELADLRERLDLLENPPVADRNGPITTGTDTEMSAAIRQHYRDYITENGICGWDFSMSLMNGVNHLILKYILRQFERQEIAQLNSLHRLHKMSITKEKCIKLRVRRNFEGQKRAWTQANTLNDEERRIISRDRNQRSRLTAKITRRRKNFRLFEADIVELFHPKESCKAFLKKEYMSEDEDDQLNRHGQTISYTTLRPSWRSTQLNKMFEELDSPAGRRTAGRPLPRNIREVVSSLPTETLARLPSWGVRHMIE
ncbi:uncharacterized protein EV154DRAFT_597570 [Mucor mucedo]|uniref:uncharacterized protein n=1 Tax=Mucor mucedo TaxID=29922 RepID=UPI002220227B|nr:uncharacterized protein EV154DRAFT_597570 [Mucor mucedo]KAI7897172.1 hypothetical protein EV154DRAFT_597570 [Mucor mucedo]